MPMPHKQVGSAWPIQLLQLTAWARGRCTRAGRAQVLSHARDTKILKHIWTAWVKYPSHWSLHGGQNRFTNSPNWRLNSPTVRLKYWYSLEIHSDVAGALGTKSGAALHAPLCVCLGRASRCVSRAQRESGPKIVHDCNYATARYKTCLSVCICVFVGTFRHWGLPKPVEWRLLNDFGKDPMPLTDIVCATQPQIGAFSQCVKNNDD